MTPADGGIFREGAIARFERGALFPYSGKSIVSPATGSGDGIGNPPQPQTSLDMKRLGVSTLFLAGFLLSITSSALRAGPDTSQLWIFRSIDGSGNNVARPERGQAHTPLIRLTVPGHGDGIDLPRGVLFEGDGDGGVEADEQSLPSARLISNFVHDQNSDGGRFIPSDRNLNQLFFQFGQFLSHDIGLTEPDLAVATGGSTGYAGNEWFPIPVPASDPDFRFSEIAFFRSIAKAPSESGTGRREQANTITAFIDGSNIYGSDDLRAERLRRFVGGLLRVTAGGPDGDLLPQNVFGEENANPLHGDPTSLYLAGDVRANEHVGLTAIHTLFVREHNRLAREIAQRDFSGANLTDPFVDEVIFQRARAVVGAILQNITYSEWLPTLLGSDRLGNYEGYKPGIDPQLSNVFTGAAFRIGHTMLPPNLGIELASGLTMDLSLRDAFFNPSFVSAYGVDPILRGFAAQPQQKIDRFVVDDVRNFLFGPVGLDLPALNIQRGRDHGVPSYNAVRESFGLSPRFDFGEVAPDDIAEIALRAAYGPGGMEVLDAWSGGITEAPLPGSSLGETFTAIFIDQFARLRDGDRFFFRNPQIYSREFIEEIEATTLVDVIRRNTGLSGRDVNAYTFFPPNYHPYQADLRVGRRARLTSHRGNGIYNAGGARQSIGLRSSRKGTAAAYVSIENDGAFAGNVRASLAGVPRRRVRVQVREAGSRGINITAALVRGAWQRRLLPGDTRVLRAKFRAKKRTRRTTVRPAFRGYPALAEGGLDAVRMFVRFR